MEKREKDKSIQSLKDQITILSGQKLKATNDLNKALEGLKLQETLVAQKQKEIDGLNSQNDNLNARLKSLSETKELLEQKITTLKNQVNGLQGDNSKLQDQKQDLNKQLTNFQKSLDSAQNQNKENQKLLENMQGQIDDLQKPKDKSQKNLNEVEKKSEDTQLKLVDQIKGLDDDKQQLQAQLEKTQQDLKDDFIIIGSLKDQGLGLQKDKIKLVFQVGSLNDQLIKRNSDIKKMSAEC